MLGAIGLVFMRHGNEFALGRDVRRRGRIVPRLLHARAAEALGLRGDVGLSSRAERVVVIVTAGWCSRPWGLLPWAIYVLTASAWVTVLQRILFVRKQFRERQLAELALAVRVLEC